MAHRSNDDDIASRLDRVVDDLTPRVDCRAWLVEQLSSGRDPDTLLAELLSTGWADADAQQLLDEARERVRGKRNVLLTPQKLTERAPRTPTVSPVPTQIPSQRPPPRRSPQGHAPQINIDYAPPARSRNRAAWVVASGLVTTAAVLAGITLLGVNPLTWFFYSIPYGAMLVGLVAGSGYAIGAKWVGIKMRKPLALTIFAVSIVSYFLADYAGFKAAGTLVNVSTGRAVGYREYFNDNAMHWTLRSGYAFSRTRQPLGILGYFFVIAGILGFAGMALAAPWWMGHHPYCDLCERYLKKRLLALWPESIKLSDDVSNRDGAAGEWEYLRQFEPIEQRLQRLAAAAHAGNVTEFRRLSTQSPKSQKRAADQLRRFEANVWSCPRCSSGYLQGVCVSGKGHRTRRAQMTRQDLPSQFVRSFIGPVS